MFRFNSTKNKWAQLNHLILERIILVPEFGSVIARTQCEPVSVMYLLARALVSKKYVFTILIDPQ